MMEGLMPKPEVQVELSIGKFDMSHLVLLMARIMNRPHKHRSLSKSMIRSKSSHKRTY